VISNSKVWYAKDYKNKIATCFATASKFKVILNLKYEHVKVINHDILQEGNINYTAHRI
jgi:hypothetical protein